MIELHTVLVLLDGLYSVLMCITELHTVVVLLDGLYSVLYMYDKATYSCSVIRWIVFCTHM